LLETLCAVALSAPSKSDLQQADIVIVSDKGQREKLEALLPDNPWVKAAPVFLVFCANNRRHRLLFQWRERPFVNDYLDPFFNASVDAGIVLATFVAAADRVGLGSCPISAIRNHAQQVSDILSLPGHVFPVGSSRRRLAVVRGRDEPAAGLDVTLHRDRYDEDGLKESIAAYDRRRAAVQPYRSQRYTDRFGEAADYGWSEDKARQYSGAGAGRISALSCAARVSGSTDLPLDLLQHVDPERAREVGILAARPAAYLVDLVTSALSDSRGPLRWRRVPARTRPPARCWSDVRGW
jgi:nitroreductase/FMN reductase [NAD(P)H]